MEKNATLAIIIISLILVGASTFALGQIYITGNIQEESFQYSFTKAVCNENNYCEDYEIVCKDNNMLEFNPTGFTVQFPSEWKDKRNKDNIEKKC